MGLPERSLRIFFFPLIIVLIPLFLSPLTKLRENLLDIPNVRNIRSMGLMIGIEMKHDIKPIIDELMDNGLLVLPTGKTVIRLLPPIIITREEIDKIIRILVLVLNN